MAADRFSWLALLYIHQEREADIFEVIKRFLQLIIIF